jgi:hypothetical protein
VAPQYGVVQTWPDVHQIEGQVLKDDINDGAAITTTAATITPVHICCTSSLFPHTLLIANTIIAQTAAPPNNAFKKDATLQIAPKSYAMAELEATAMATANASFLVLYKFSFI